MGIDSKKFNQRKSKNNFPVNRTEPKSAHVPRLLFIDYHYPGNMRAEEVACLQTFESVNALLFFLI